MRPEDAAVARLATVLDARVHAYADGYMLAFADDGHAFVAAQCREISLAVCPTLTVPAARWRDGASLAEATGGKFLILAAYKDGDLVYVFDRRDVISRAVWCGFNGREPTIHVPTKLMLPLL